MKRKFISVMLIALLVIGTYTVAAADEITQEYATRNSLKSYGDIVYTDGENSVEIYSDDLYLLADQLDLFKTSMANQLAQMNTYLTSGSDGISTTSDSNIKILHTLPDEGETVAPLALGFDVLLEGLAASQSIPTDVTEYGYPEETMLYITSDGELVAADNGETEEADPSVSGNDADDGGEAGSAETESLQEVTITAATPENLSAGTAAWVNGELLLGTGADNKSWYDRNTVDPESIGSIVYGGNTVIQNIIDIVYSGNTETVTYSDGSGATGVSSASVDGGSKDSDTGSLITYTSEKIQVWDLESDSDSKKLMNTLNVGILCNRGGGVNSGTTPSGTISIYDEDDNLIYSRSLPYFTPNTGSYVRSTLQINMFTLPISTQYIYVVATARASVSNHADSDGEYHSGSCKIYFDGTTTVTYLTD
ncbi:MAG: hypothetical protein LUI12_10030 [Clostridiales bacterium]|nr:hypothetical protein [Clostridiales bacterium]